VNRDSKGSIGYSGVWEFIVGPDFCLYRAPRHNPIDTNGYRQGARHECEPRSDGFARYLRDQGFDPLTRD
jgi:hypothetical protein